MNKVRFNVELPVHILVKLDVKCKELKGTPEQVILSLLQKVSEPSFDERRRRNFCAAKGYDTSKGYDTCRVAKA